jgi:hypothetical protein
MAIPTVLVATWNDGLFVVVGQTERQQRARLRVIKIL